MIKRLYSIAWNIVGISIGYLNSILNVFETQFSYSVEALDNLFIII